MSVKRDYINCLQLCYNATQQKHVKLDCFESAYMSNIFNVYCDESGHLQNDNLQVMVLGAVWCPAEKTEDRVLIALNDFGYVVILADRGEYVLLWTAYCVEREHSRQKLRKEYEAFISLKG